MFFFYLQVEKHTDCRKQASLWLKCLQFVFELKKKNEHVFPSTYILMCCEEKRQQFDSPYCGTAAFV